MPDESTSGIDAPTEPPPGASAASKPQAKKLPGFAVAAAGLAVFDTLLAIAFLFMWLGNGQAALVVIQTLAGVSILLGLSAIVISGLIFNSNRRTGKAMPGTVWARAGIAAGLFLLGVAVMLPLISALSVLVGSGA